MISKKLSFIVGDRRRKRKEVGPTRHRRSTSRT